MRYGLSLRSYNERRRMARDMWAIYRVASGEAVAGRPDEFERR